jgi:hypothetical protein
MFEHRKPAIRAELLKRIPCLLKMRARPVARDFLEYPAVSQKVEGNSRISIVSLGLRPIVSTFHFHKNTLAKRLYHKDGSALCSCFANTSDHAHISPVVEDCDIREHNDGIFDAVRGN